MCVAFIRKNRLELCEWVLIIGHRFQTRLYIGSIGFCASDTENAFLILANLANALTKSLKSTVSKWLWYHWKRWTNVFFFLFYFCTLFQEFLGWLKRIVCLAGPRLFLILWGFGRKAAIACCWLSDWCRSWLLLSGCCCAFWRALVISCCVDL